MSKTKTFIIVILLILIGGIIMAGIVHKVVKSSGEKGLATEWNDDHEITGDIDLDQNQFLNQVIENRADFPAGPVEGQIVYRSDLDATYIWDGTAWSFLSRRVNYWSCSGVAFTTFTPAVDDVWLDGDEGILLVNSGTAWAMTPVYLPHGAVVTAVKVFGLAAGKNWFMRRIDPENIGNATNMATAAIGVEDTTITNPTIDNQNYFYQIETSIGLAVNNMIYGARITYTL